MSHPKSLVPSFASRAPLFAHREFPPYVALERVRALVDQVVRRQEATAPPDLLRVSAPLADIAARLESAAGGNLTLTRWYRRIVVSVRRCHQAKLQVANCQRVGVMTSEESREIGVAIDAMIDRLHESVARADLAEDAERSLPSSAAPALE